MCARPWLQILMPIAIFIETCFPCCFHSAHRRRWTGCFDDFVQIRFASTLLSLPLGSAPWEPRSANHNWLASLYVIIGHPLD